MTARGVWGFDEPSGSTAVDSSGLGNDGTISGSTSRVSGQHGGALRFTGSGGVVTVANHASLRISGAISVAAWTRPENTGTADIVSKSVLGSIDGYELVYASSTIPFFRVNQATSGDTYRANALSAVPQNGSTWVHLAGTYDGTNLRLYVNGTLVSTVTGPASIGTSSTALALGAHPGGTRPYLGYLDDVRIYAEALTAEQIATVMAGGDPAGSTVHDASGTIAASSGSAAEITAALVAAGTAEAVSAASGQAAAVRATSGTVIAASGVAGDASVTQGSTQHDVSGTVAATSATTGAVTRSATVSGSVHATSAAAGQGTARRPASGAVVGTSATTGHLSARRRVSGTASGVSVVAGTLAPTGTTGTVAAVSGVSGALTARRSVSGQVSALSATAGAPVIAGHIPTPVGSITVGTVRARHTTGPAQARHHVGAATA